MTGHFFKRRRSPVPFHLRTEILVGEGALGLPFEPVAQQPIGLQNISLWSEKNFHANVEIG